MGFFHSPEQDGIVYLHSIYTALGVIRFKVHRWICVSHMQMPRHFTKETWACVEFGIHRGLGISPPRVPGNNCIHCYKICKEMH